MDNPTETESEPYQIFHLGFVVDKVGLEQVSLRVLRLCLVIVIPPIAHIRLPFMYHSHAVYIILDMASSVQNVSLFVSLSHGSETSQFSPPSNLLYSLKNQLKSYKSNFIS